MSNVQRFAGKNVFVTGAGQGIGHGICTAFASEGASVGLNDLRAELAQQAADDINQQIGEKRVHPLVGDIADTNSLSTMFDEYRQKVGVPHIVVANAGLSTYVEFLNCTPDTFDHTVGVNLRGTYFTAQIAAKHMIDAGIPGRIILMSSVVGLQAFQNFSVYSATKAAIQMLAKSLALELSDYHINVNTVSPGATLTERTQQEDPNYAENWATVNMTGRVGYVEDIANTILFLSSDAASQINGQNIVIDGGWVIRSPIPEDHPDLPTNSD